MRFVSQGYQLEDTRACQLRASEEGLRAFVEGRYGLTAHWGLYALNGRGEWVYYVEKIPFDVYRRRMGEFNPSRFCAEEWADLMLESGHKFFLITSKHHDGFCLWDAEGTDFKVTNTTFGRDILAELAPALRDRGIALHFYYSLLDWTHPAYRKDWPRYVAYYQGQIRELCTRFGPLGGILFDGYWPRTVFEGEENEWFPPRGDWDLAGTYRLIHELQPHAVVVNNHHVPPLPGEDYQVWELDLPGKNTVGFNTTEVGEKAKATWWNLNGAWAYAPRSHAVKSADTILSTMRAVHAQGAVFMLNIGPRPFGDIHPEEQQVLREIGQCLRRYHL